MFLTTAAIGFLQPFVPLYLEAAGLQRFQIGLVNGLGVGFALLIQPVLGWLSDRLDARRSLMAAAALSSGFAYLSYRSAHSFLAFLLLSAVGVNGTLYLTAAGAVLIGRLVAHSSRGGAAYAGYRVWGSVGYIVVALLTGWLTGRGLTAQAGLGRAALTPVFTYGPLLFFATALMALLIPDRKEARPQGQEPRPRSKEPFAASPNLKRFLLAFFFYQFALYGASAYISLFLKSLHATSFEITRTFAAGVVCEVLVMTRIGRFTDRYGRRPALAIAFLMLPLRLLFYIPATGPLWVLCVQLLHGFNFGIMGAIAVVFANDTVTDRHRAQAQARLAGVGGLATALGPAACGWIVQRAGFGWMFATMSAVGAFSMLLFMARVQESHPESLPVAATGPVFLRPLLRWLDGPE